MRKVVPEALTGRKGDYFDDLGQYKNGYLNMREGVERFYLA
jgi:hypothetical protein